MKWTATEILPSSFPCYKVLSWSRYGNSWKAALRLCRYWKVGHSFFGHWKSNHLSLTLPSHFLGVANLDSDENEIDGSDEHVQAGEMPSGQRPKLQNSIAGLCLHVIFALNIDARLLTDDWFSFSGLITRFLPAIEAFFMVNTPSHSVDNGPGASEDSDDNRRVVQFAASNKILL